MIAQELKKIKMTGTIKEYITAYKDIRDRAPTSMNFDNPSTRVNFYDHLKPYVMRHFNLNVCETLQDCFQEGKHAAQQADSLHANQPGKQKDHPTDRKDTCNNKQPVQPNGNNNHCGPPHAATLNIQSTEEDVDAGKEQGSA